MKTPAEAFNDAIALDAPLSERLEHYRLAMRDISPTTSGIYERIIERLVAANAGDKSPDVGDVVAPFAAADDQGRLVTLDELIGDGPLVFSLNRGHWCSYCRMELRHLATLQKDVEALGGSIAAITPETRPFARKIKEGQGPRFPVLTDTDHTVALEFGLLIWLGDELETYFTKAGVDIPRYQGMGGWFAPIPATYVLGKGRVVLARFMDPDFTKRMAADAILDAVRAGSVGRVGA